MPGLPAAVLRLAKAAAQRRLICEAAGKFNLSLVTAKPTFRRSADQWSASTGMKGTMSEFEVNYFDNARWRRRLNFGDLCHSTVAASHRISTHERGI
jgi:hypothetical protein